MLFKRYLLKIGVTVILLLIQGTTYAQKSIRHDYEPLGYVTSIRTSDGYTDGATSIEIETSKNNKVSCQEAYQDGNHDDNGNLRSSKRVLSFLEIAKMSMILNMDVYSDGECSLKVIKS